MQLLLLNQVHELGNFTMTAENKKTQTHDWKVLNCPRGHFIGHTNHKAIIFGGCLIQQSSVCLFCSQCKQSKRYFLQTDKKMIRFVTDAEITEIVKNMNNWNDKNNLPTKSLDYLVLKKDGTTEVMYFAADIGFWHYITENKELRFADGELFPWKEIENKKIS